MNLRTLVSPIVGVASLGLMKFQAINTSNAEPYFSFMAKHAAGRDWVDIALITTNYIWDHSSFYTIPLVLSIAYFCKEFLTEYRKIVQKAKHTKERTKRFIRDFIKFWNDRKNNGSD